MRLHQNLEWVERETIRRALDQAGGVKKDAAELMGISQRALSYYLRNTASIERRLARAFASRQDYEFR